MIHVLANDGIAPEGKAILENNGFSVDTNKIPQNELAGRLNNYEVILVRSATQVTAEIMDASPSLKLIGRAGVGLDNIDVDHAFKKGITVINTPAASSLSVAELVFAHMFSMSRNLHRANRELCSKGSSAFNSLKKDYSKGMELRGKTLGIVGLGRIGQEVAKIGFGLGMNVIAYDPNITEVYLKLDFLQLTPTPEVSIKTSSFDDVISSCHYLTFHVPGSEGKYVMGEQEISKMKKGAYLINAARGGVIDEKSLLSALDNGHLSGAALDVYENEPHINEALLSNSKISFTPHTGASTVEAQDRIGIEIAQKIVDFYKS